MQTAARRPAFAGRGVSGARLDAEAAAASVTLPVTHTFSGFDAFDDVGQIGLVTTVASAAALPASSVAFRMTLATRTPEGVFGVAREPIAYTLPDGTTGVVTTDDRGDAVVAGDGGFDPALALGGAPLGVATELPAGSYALVVELVQLPGMTSVGRPQAVVYDVAYTGSNDTPADPVPPPPATPGAPPTTAPAGSAPSTAPPPTTPAAGPETPPSTTPATTPAASPTTPATTAPAPPTTNAPEAPPAPATTSPAAPGAPVTAAPPSTATPPEQPAPQPPAVPVPTTEPDTSPTTAPLPAIPARPFALDGTALDRGVRLTWQPGPGAAPTGYRVWRDGQFAAQTAGTHIELHGLTNGRAYQFAVSAYSPGGESARSTPFTLAPAAPTRAAPEPPSGEPVPTTAPAPTTTAGHSDTRAVVVPDHGPAGGGTHVSISAAELAAHEVLAVFIGGSAQRLDHHFGTTVGITTRPHVAGTFDVELVLAGGGRIVVADRFTFERDGPISPPASEPGDANPAPPAAPPAAPPTTAPSGTSPPATAPPAPAPPPATSPSVTTPPPPAASPPATEPPATAPPATVPARQLPTGSITPGAALTGLPAGMWSAVRCRTSPCAGIVL